MMRQFRCAVVVSLLALAACNSESPDSDLVTIRDSANIEIVENHSDLWSAASTWRVAAAPAVRIGALEGQAAYLFDGVRGIAVLSDGRVVVSNSGDNSLRWFDRDGQAVLQRGGTGEGPGEFSRLGVITVARGDSIVAMDWSNARTTVFGPDGEFGRTVPIVGLAAPPGHMYLLPSNEWIVGISGASTRQLGPDPQPGRYRFHSPVLRISSDGSTVDTLGMFPSNEVEIMLRDDGARIFGPARMARDLYYAVRGNQVIVGTADGLRFDVYSPEGQHLRSVRSPDIGVLMNPEIDERYRAYHLSRVADAPPEAREARERSIAAIELPDTVPAYGSLLVDDRGNVWLGQFINDLATPRYFVVFDPEGHFLTTVTLPDNFRPMAIADQRLWGRTTDDVGVEYVEAYALESADTP